MSEDRSLQEGWRLAQATRDATRHALRELGATAPATDLYDAAMERLHETHSVSDADLADVELEVTRVLARGMK